MSSGVFLFFFLIKPPGALKNTTKGLNTDSLKISYGPRRDKIADVLYLYYYYYDTSAMFYIFDRIRRILYPLWAGEE